MEAARPDDVLAQLVCTNIQDAIHERDRQVASGASPQWLSQVSFKAVNWSNTPEGMNVFVLFEHSSRRGCTFGYQWSEMALDLDDFELEHFRQGRVERAAKRLANDFLIDLEEVIEAGDLGFPPPCQPGTTTWIG